MQRVARKMFESLRVRNFRLFISGQAISITGTWMQSVAIGWLVLQITGSGTAVGVTLALQFGPLLLLGLWGGVIADRHDKRLLLLGTQSFSALIALTLWIVSVTGTTSLTIIYGLVLIQGVVTALDNPTRQSFVTEMVGKDLVANAIGLHSAVFNMGRIVGPAIGGILIAGVGVSWVFLINALTFTGVLVGLKAMDPAVLFRGVPTIREPGQVRAGLRYSWRVRSLRYTIAMMGIFSTFGLNFSVILPLLSRFSFHTGPEGFGFLTSMISAGALLGALVAAARNRPSREQLIASAGVFGVLMLVASTTSSFAVLAFLLVCIGGCSMTFISTANSTLQLTADRAMRGRVMSLHALVFLGSTALGAPLIGWICETWGPEAGLFVGGVAAVATALAGVVGLKRTEIEERLRVVASLGRRPQPETEVAADQ